MSEDLVTITLTDNEWQHVENALQSAITSYKRSQKQRPEFYAISKKLENELHSIIIKLDTTTAKMFTDKNQ